MEEKRSGKRRGKEMLGDLAAWERENGEDNSEQLERLRRNLEVQPWDEYMLAVRHVAFQDVL